MRDKWRGSATVEAAIIMPVFLILLMTMLMFAMFVYEKAAMRSVCNHIAAEGAAIWQRGYTYMKEYYDNGSTPPPEKQDKIHIYHIYAGYFANITDIGRNDKIKLLEEQARKEMARRSFLLGEKDIKATVKLESIIIHKRLTVIAEAEYNLMFYKNTSNIHSHSVISGQTELIRTIDLGADLLLDGPLAGVKSQYDKVIGKLKDLIEKVEIEK